MSMLDYYLIASTIMFGFLSLVWKNSDWMNVLLRLMFVIGTLVGLFLVGESFGVIIQL